METQKNSQEYLGYVMPKVHDSLKIAASEINGAIGGLGFISILRLAADSPESLEVNARRIAEYQISNSVAHVYNLTDIARLHEQTEIVTTRLRECDNAGDPVFVPVRIRCFNDVSLSELWSRTGALAASRK